MLKLYVLLLMSIASFPLRGQYEKPTKINLTVIVNSGHFLNELVSPAGIIYGCGVWTLEEFVLLDSLQNEIQKEVRWCRGTATSTTQKFQFDQLKAASVYYLQYKNNGQLEMDTIRLKTIKSQEISIKINEEESQNVLKKPTFTEQLAEGDTLFVKFNEYCNGTKGELMIIFKDGKYNAVLNETTGKIYKTFRKYDIGKPGIAMLEAFEWDSRRPISRNSCHDTGSFYTLLYKNEITRIADFCGVWNGYFLLKKGLFKD